MDVKSVAKPKATLLAKIDEEAAMFCDGAGVDALGHELDFPSGNFREAKPHDSCDLGEVVWS